MNVIRERGRDFQLHGGERAPGFMFIILLRKIPYIYILLDLNVVDLVIIISFPWTNKARIQRNGSGRPENA